MGARNDCLVGWDTSAKAGSFNSTMMKNYTRRTPKPPNSWGRGWRPVCVTTESGKSMGLTTHHAGRTLLLHNSPPRLLLSDKREKSLQHKPGGAQIGGASQNDVLFGPWYCLPFPLDLVGINPVISPPTSKTRSLDTWLLYPTSPAPTQEKTDTRCTKRTSTYRVFRERDRRDDRLGHRELPHSVRGVVCDVKGPALHELVRRPPVPPLEPRRQRRRRGRRLRGVLAALAASSSRRCCLALRCG